MCLRESQRPSERGRDRERTERERDRERERERDSEQRERCDRRKLKKYLEQIEVSRKSHKFGTLRVKKGRLQNELQIWRVGRIKIDNLVAFKNDLQLQS